MISGSQFNYKTFRVNFFASLLFVLDLLQPSLFRPSVVGRLAGGRANDGCGWKGQLAEKTVVGMTLGLLYKQMGHFESLLGCTAGKSGN